MRCLVEASRYALLLHSCYFTPFAQPTLSIVVDIAPGVGKISPEFRAYLDAMKEIDAAQVHSRKEADAILEKTEPVSCHFPHFAHSACSDVGVQDLGIRQFLLTNLDRESPTSPYKFRLPLSYLRNAIDEIGNFPFAPGERIYDKPSLFLKGSFLVDRYLFPAETDRRGGRHEQVRRVSTSTAGTSRSSTNSSRIRDWKLCILDIGVSSHSLLHVPLSTCAEGIDVYSACRTTERVHRFVRWVLEGVDLGKG